MDLYSRYVEQLVRMGSTPGAQHYAKARAQELEADPSGLFRGIYQAVNDQIKAGLDKPTESDNPSPEKLL